MNRHLVCPIYIGDTNNVQTLFQQATHAIGIASSKKYVATSCFVSNVAEQTRCVYEGGLSI
ncbi:MAG: hypothetical protein RSD98_10150 [Niameybacter sp.]